MSLKKQICRVKTKKRKNEIGEKSFPSAINVVSHLPFMMEAPKKK